MDKPKPEVIKAFREICKVMVEAVKAGDQTMGTPGGHLYAAVMGYMSLGQFEQLMALLVGGGYLRKRGQCYFWVKDL